MVRSRVFEPPDLLVASLEGVVTSNDQAVLLAWVREWIRRTGEVRVLLRLETFVGWNADSSLDEAALWLRDDEQVSRMAVVGHRSWRVQVMTIFAQPLRRIPIHYFETEKAARQWLMAHAASTLNTMFI
jgi:hypothetical protein